MRGAQIVLDRVSPRGGRQHRIRDRALLCQMDDRVGALGDEKIAESFIVPREVELGKAKLLAADVTPCVAALLHRQDWGQRCGAELVIQPAPREIIDDRDVVATA